MTDRLQTWHVVRLRKDGTRQPLCSKVIRANADRLAEDLARVAGCTYLVIDPLTGDTVHRAEHTTTKE